MKKAYITYVLISAGIFIILNFLNIQKALELFELILDKTIVFGFSVRDPIRIIFFILLLSFVPLVSFLLKKIVKTKLFFINLILLFSALSAVILRLIHVSLNVHNKEHIQYGSLHLEEALLIGMILAATGLFILAKREKSEPGSVSYNLKQPKKKSIRRILRASIVIMSILTLLFISLVVLVRWPSIYAQYTLRKTDYEITEMKYDASGLRLGLRTEISGKTYDVTFGSVKPRAFNSNQFSIVIREINDYSLVSCICSQGFLAYGGSINLRHDPMLRDYLNIQEGNILWIMENIDHIESRFMKIPTDSYMHIKKLPNYEGYFKRIAASNWLGHNLKTDLMEDPSLFIFKNCPEVFPATRKKALELSEK